MVPTPRTAPKFLPLYLGAAFALYVLAESGLFPAAGINVTALEIVPITAIAWLCGVWPGVFMGIILLIWDFAVFLPGRGIDGIRSFVEHGWPGAVPLFFVAGVVGRLHSLQKKLEAELENRQSVERERDRVEKSVRESEARLNLALDVAEMGMWDWDIVSNKTVWSEGMHRIFAPMLRSRGMVKEQFLEIVHPEDLAALTAAIAKVLESSKSEQIEHEIEFRVVDGDGAIRWVLNRGKPLRDENGRAVRLLGITLDITERKLSEERLRESEQRFQVVSQATKDVIYDWDVPRDSLWWSENLQVIFGYAPEQIGSSVTWWKERIHPDERARVLNSLEEIIKDGRIWEQEYRFRRADDSYAFIYERGFVLRNSNGTPVRMIGSVMDITARKQAEDALRNREEFYRALLENSTDNITVYTPDGVTVYESPSTELLSGHKPEELQGRNNFSLIHPDDVERVSEAFEKALLSDSPSPAIRYRFRHKDGSMRQVESVGRRFTDETGKLLVIVNTRDISERETLEKQLRQSQKMEAIGTLAGGVAHDFNNLLTVILNYGQLAMESIEPTSPVRCDLGEIIKASERASCLTRQLLAFSRKQELEPEVTTFNALVEEMNGMLSRLIGDDIELRSRLTSEAWNIKVDVGQIEQVILNLVVNARDAMPDGGVIVLETRNETLTISDAESTGFSPGDYAVLAVTDTGIGMDDETRERIFEPFFTTKELGKGTGLGLSTVYGIVEQSSGKIDVKSQLGLGTTFKVYIPQTNVPPVSNPRTITSEPRSEGSETILLVEDEPTLRQLTKHVLQKHGYGVIEAENAIAASKTSARYEGTIHLLLTDVVMPGESGRQLAEELQPKRPDMRVLYMSGYTDDAVMRHGIQHSKIRLLQKPFKPADLLREVRRMLDGH